MRFNDWVASKPREYRGTSQEYIRELMRTPSLGNSFVDTACSVIEMGWSNCERPFYNVYPIAVDLCVKTSMNMKWGDILFPQRYLCLRFAEGHEPLGIQSCILRVPSDAEQSTILEFHRTRIDYAKVLTATPIAAIIQTKELRAKNQKHLWLYAKDDIRDEVIGDTFSGNWDLFGEDGDSRDRSQFLIRMLAFIGLLARGTDLITPAILAKDRNEYDATSNDSRKSWLEARAVKRQGKGFDVGRYLEIDRASSPHWRSPHLALFHTGPGRTVPVLKVRSGCVVIPNDMSNVPTGFLGPESPDEQVEENSTRYRSSLSPKTRFAVLRRDKYTCRLCGMTAADGIKLQVDHIIPKAKGGTDDMTNLQTTCQPCNSGKSASDLYLPESLCEDAPARHQPGVVA